MPGFKTYFPGTNQAYFKTSMASVAEFPDLIRDAFINDEVSDTGIYNVRFFIRGKPWVVTIDDYMAFYEVDDEPALMFGSTYGDSIWAALLEKAWAKVKGNYLNAQYDFTSNGIRALTGVPVFDYHSDDFAIDEDKMDEMWRLLREADQEAYIISAGTAQVSRAYELNGCGLANAHSYTIVSVFTMEEKR